MTYKAPDRTYGLMLDSRHDYGTHYIALTVMCREEGKEHPLGISSFAWEHPKHLEGLTLDGLGMTGFVSDINGNQFIGYNIEFRNVYSVDGCLARKMLRTLDKVNGVIAKSHAYEPGDKMMALAKALRLSWVVEKIDNNRRHGSSWSDSDWRWMTVEEGRNRYRDIIRDAVETANGSKAA